MKGEGFEHKNKTCKAKPETNQLFFLTFTKPNVTDILYYYANAQTK